MSERRNENPAPRLESRGGAGTSKTNCGTNYRGVRPGLQAGVDPVSEFRAAMAAAGLAPPDVIVPDGALHRFSTNGKAGDRSGWYCLHSDGTPAGAFGCWRTGIAETWRADLGRPLTGAEESAHRARVATMKLQREAAEAERRTEASARARTIWDQAPAAPSDHAYLQAKGIEPHSARLHEGSLVVPLRANGELHSLQFIRPDGSKQFLGGGRVAGCYAPIGDPSKAPALCIVEGYATGATVHQATGLPVAVAYTAGNLMAVAKTMRAKFPNLPLVVCADDDYLTADNPGKTKAAEAVKAVGGRLVVPDFGLDRPQKATDFNDLYLLQGWEAIRRSIDEVLQGRDEVPQDRDEALQDQDAVEILCAADIQPEPIDWVWGGWLAAGKLHVLAGAPGTGKTSLALALGAAITTGGRWPDGARAPLGDILIWSGEDDARDTLVPRLMACGADRARAHIVGRVGNRKKTRTFDPATDLPSLETAARSIGRPIRLLIVDPIVSAIAGDSHKNAEVRRALAPLVDLGNSLRCAVVGISHFSKSTAGQDPVDRVTGSLAFGALARVVLAVAKLPDREEHQGVRILARAKSNVGPDEGGYEYHLELTEVAADIEATRVTWGAAVSGTAQELLASCDPEAEEERSDLGKAMSFLRSMLADGPRPSKRIAQEAREAGHAERTLSRAKKNLGVLAEKDGQGPWMLALPAANGEVCQRLPNIPNSNSWQPWQPSVSDTQQTTPCEEEPY